MPGTFIKGRAVLDTLDSIRGRAGDEDLERILRLLDAATAEHFRSSIVVSQWFPLEAYVRFVALVIEKINGGDVTPFVKGSEAVLERQLTGAYSMFIRSGAPGAVVKRIAAVHETYFRGVALAFVSFEEGHAVIRYTGFAAQHRLMEHPIAAFYRKALEMSGAKRIDVGFTTPIGDPEGHADLSIRWA